MQGHTHTEKKNTNVTGDKNLILKYFSILNDDYVFLDFIR